MVPLLLIVFPLLLMVIFAGVPVFAFKIPPLRLLMTFPFCNCKPFELVKLAVPPLFMVILPFQLPFASLYTPPGCTLMCSVPLLMAGEVQVNRPVLVIHIWSPPWPKLFALFMVTVPVIQITSVPSVRFKFTDPEEKVIVHVPHVCAPKFVTPINKINNNTNL